MASEKTSQAISGKELERRYTKLSLKVQEAKEEFKPTKGESQQPLMQKPMLYRAATRERDATKEDIIQQIEELQQLCQKTTEGLNRKIEAMEAEETRSKLTVLLDFVLHCF